MPQIVSQNNFNDIICIYRAIEKSPVKSHKRRNDQYVLANREISVRTLQKFVSR